MKGYTVKTWSGHECPKRVGIWKQQGYGNFAGILWQSDDGCVRHRGQLYCSSTHCSVTAEIIAQGKWTVTEQEYFFSYEQKIDWWGRQYNGNACHTYLTGI